MQTRIVEYMEHGTFLVAVVLEENDRRLRIVNHKGREGNLPRSRVVHASAPLAVPADRAGQLRLLAETDGRRAELAAGLDLAAVWDVVREEGGNLLEPDFLAELAFGGEVDDDRMAAFWRCVFTDRLYFKFRDGKLLVHPPDKVEQLAAQQRLAAERQRLIAEGGARLRAVWQGDDPGNWPDRQRCLDVIESYAIHGKEAEERDLAVALLKEAGISHPHGPYLLLVRAGRWQEHENVALHRAAIPLEFSETERAAARDLAMPAVEELLAQGYTDLRHLDLFTVDAASTLDRDDALHLRRLEGGQVEVGIHITDVAAFLPVDSPLFLAAESRVTSIYLPDGQVPMLPETVSQGVLSLTAGVQRPAVSFIARLDRDGGLLDTSILRSVVQVRRNETYEEFDRLAQEPESDAALLHRLACRLQDVRVERGGLVLLFPDVVFHFVDGEVARVELAPVDTPGRLAVAECMVLANTMAAEYLAQRAIPGLYRSQGRPGQRLVKRPTRDLFLNYRQRKHLSPGAITTMPKPHAGVGADQYTTVTSPIRRFLDLVMQHQLCHALAGKGVLFSEERLRDWAGVIYRRQGVVNQLRNTRQRYWLATYLARHQGRRFPALILGRGPRRVQFVLPDFLLDGDLPPNPAVGGKPGDTVMVRIARVDPLEGLIRFEW